MTAVAWSGAFAPGNLRQVLPLPLPAPTRDWALADATGAGVRVAIVDSGVDASHPAVGRLARSMAVASDDSGFRVLPAGHEDVVGHGTACAGIITSLAPDVELTSVRVLGANLRGSGGALLAAVRWTVEEGFDVVNMSLSTGKRAWYEQLHELADIAYFKGVSLVCAANNVPGPTYPSEFSSVISCASMVTDDPWTIACNPHPPVEFAARGIDVEVAWSGGGTCKVTGNSFATPHVAGLVALVKSKHPGLSSFQVKTVLQALAVNVPT